MNTYPHHKHENGQVSPSHRVTIVDVLDQIEEKIAEKRPYLKVIGSGNCQLISPGQSKRAEQTTSNISREATVRVSPHVSVANKKMVEIHSFNNLCPKNNIHSTLLIFEINLLNICLSCSHQHIISNLHVLDTGSIISRG